MLELELIAELNELLASPDPRVIRAGGDDAAVVLARGGYAVTSVDTMVEDVHFRSDWLTPAEIGHRALAGALSDLGAMGAVPGEAYLALGLPRGSDRAAARAMVAAAAALAREYGVTIAGGDVTAAPALFLSFTVVGWVEDPGELVGREGARPGDLVCVTGALGGAGSGLAVLDGAAIPASPAEAQELRRRYARPQPRLAEGRALALAGASAMIDVSDGLATDAAHIGRASGVELEIELAALPLAPGVAAVAEQLEQGAGPLRAQAFAAQAGEDYELCVCAPPSARATIEAALAATPDRAPVTWIGKVAAPGPAGPGACFAGATGPLAGYEHAL